MLSDGMRFVAVEKGKASYRKFKDETTVSKINFLFEIK